jgi:hypothetical protein
MIKVIGSAVAGYIVIFAAVFGLMSGAWFAVGVDGTFLPGVWDVTATWLVLMLAAAVIAAVLGGYVTALFGDSRGPLGLMGIVFVLGIALALPDLLGPGMARPAVRPDVLPMFEAMQYGKQPAWVALLNPVLGAVGVLLGARLRARQSGRKSRP